MVGFSYFEACEYSLSYENQRKEIHTYEWSNYFEQYHLVAMLFWTFQKVPITDFQIWTRMLLGKYVA